MTLEQLEHVVNLVWNNLKLEDGPTLTEKYMTLTGLNYIMLDKDGKSLDIDEALETFEDDAEKEIFVNRLYWCIPGGANVVRETEYDVNKDTKLDNKDLKAVKTVIDKGDGATEEEKAAADVNKDETVDEKDLEAVGDVVSKVSPEIVMKYTAKTAAEYNATLEGAVKAGDPKPAEEVTSTAFDYIYDEASWNASYENGVLKYYYTKYPDEDRYNTQEHRWAWDVDKVDGEWPDYCVQCWEGAVSANAAKFPWVCPKFDTDVNATITFKYEGKDDVQPWGDSVFGVGRKADGTDRMWGIASVAEEFKDNGFLIEENKNNGDESWVTTEAFDIAKFTMVLVSQEVKTYTEKEADAYNATLDGAVKKGDYILED